MAYDVSDPEGNPTRKTHGNAAFETEFSVPRLERLRSEILSGTYHVPSEELAESLIRSMHGSRKLLN